MKFMNIKLNKRKEVWNTERVDGVKFGKSEKCDKNKREEK